MEPIQSPVPDRQLSLRATVAEAAPAFLNGAEILAVADAEGQPVGCLRRDAVIQVMLEG
jgi:glycine betaine/proline transport system ATP-binding protein